MLLQTAVATATTADPLGGHLVQGAVVLILGLQGWSIRATFATRDEVRTFRQALFGVNGDNGINGTQKEHTTALNDLDTRMAQAEAYIERTVPERLKLWEGFRENTQHEVTNLWSAFHKIRTAWAARQRLLDNVEEDRRAGYGRRQGDTR